MYMHPYVSDNISTFVLDPKRFIILYSSFIYSYMSNVS